MQNRNSGYGKVSGHATLILGKSLLTRCPGLRNGEVVAASLFYQFTLYIAVRLAHHGFTLGELSLVSFGATVLFMEMMNLTIARVRRMLRVSQLGLTHHVNGVDMVLLNPFHQDLPAAHATAHLSDRPHSRLVSRWVPSISSSFPFQTSCPPPCPPAQVSRGEATPASFTRTRLLRWHLANRWRPHWTVGTLVSGK